MFFHRLIAVAQQRTHQGWGNPQGRHTLTPDQRPEAIGAGIVERTIVEYHRGSQERRSQHLPRTHHPAEVGDPIERVRLL